MKTISQNKKSFDAIPEGVRSHQCMLPPHPAPHAGERSNTTAPTQNERQDEGHGDAEQTQTPGSLDKIRVSIFRGGVEDKTAVEVGLVDVLKDIQGGHYAGPITDLRKLKAEGKREEAGRTKKLLPAFTVSGTARSRKEMVSHSGLLQVDLDHVGERLAELTAALRKDPHVAFGFISPSGDGIKLGVAIDGSRHRESFEVAEAYFKNEYGMQIDPQCKEQNRLCFVSHDPGLWKNDAAVCLAIEKDEKVLPLNSPKSYMLHPFRSVSLDNCVSASSTPLHNNQDLDQAECIKSRKTALAELCRNHPELVGLYEKLVENRFQAKPNGRNDFLVQTIPFLYRAVAPPFVLVLVGCFYDCNRPLFGDSRDQHMKEAQAMLEGVKRTYEASLEAKERALYESLDGIERAVFRICKDLASLKEPPREAGSFYLAYGHLGDRIGVYPPEAQRIMRRFERGYGLLRLVKKGTRREKGSPGRAGAYLWLLKSDRLESPLIGPLLN